MTLGGWPITIQHITTFSGACVMEEPNENESSLQELYKEWKTAIDLFFLRPDDYIWFEVKKRNMTINWGSSPCR